MNRLLLAVAVLLAVLALGAAWLWAGSPRFAGPAAPMVLAQSRGAASSDLAELDGASATDSHSSQMASEQRSEGRSARGLSADEESIRVVVLDQDRQPIQGARVSAASAPGAAGIETDEKGECVLWVASEEGRIELEVQAEGFRHERMEVWIADPIELRLHRLTRVSGQVLEHKRASPVGGATVELFDGHEGCEPERVVARADGSFELATAPLGLAFHVELSADGFADAEEEFRIFDAADPGRLQLELERSAGLRLRVKDFQTGLPIAGARLDLSDGAESDERGEIDARALLSASSGAIGLRVSAPGYCRLDRQLEPREWQEHGNVSVLLLRAAAFEGVVLDPDGRAVEGARIELEYDSWSPAPRERLKLALPDGWPPEWRLSAEDSEEVLSAADGRIRSPGVVPGTPEIAIHAHKPGWEPTTAQLGAAGGPGSLGWIELRLRPQDAGRIQGQLTFQGEPVRGRIFWSGATREGHGPADAKGRFELADVEPGKVRLGAGPRLGADDYGRLLDELGFDVELERGATLERDIALEVAPAPIAGRVRTGSGRPLERVQVVANLREKEARFQARTDADGRFELALPQVPGEFRVTLVGPWSAPRKTTRAGERDLEFVVEDRGLVRLRVIDAESGRAMRDYEIHGKRSADRGFQHLASTAGSPADPEGWCQVEAPSGPLQLQVGPHDRRYSPLSAAATVPPPGAAALRLTLTAVTGHRLVLRLPDDAAFPPRGSEPWLLEEEYVGLLPARGAGADPWSALNQVFADPRRLRERRITFGKDRRATLRGLPDGRYRLLNPLRPVTFEPATIELPRDADGPILLQWKPAE